MEFLEFFSSTTVESQSETNSVYLKAEFLPKAPPGIQFSPHFSTGKAKTPQMDKKAPFAPPLRLRIL